MMSTDDKLISLYERFFNQPQLQETAERLRNGPVIVEQDALCFGPVTGLC